MPLRLRVSAPEFIDAIKRFPEAALAAAAATAIALFMVATPGQVPADAVVRGYLLSGMYGMLALAAALVAETRGLGVGSRAALQLAGLGGLTALIYNPVAFDLSPTLLALALALSVSLAPFTRRAPANNAFWAFNHDVWLAASTGLMAALLIGGGISAILETLRLLFQIEFHPRAHVYLWAVAGHMVAPLTWLTLVPKRLVAEDTEFAAHGVFRAVKFLGRYILVPLLLIYALILYAYAAKIGWDGALPQGQIGWLVLIFGAIGTLTTIVTYPTRNAGGLLTEFFWRYWFVILSGPALLLFLALATRAEQYGITERRYLVFQAGIWFLLLAILLRPRHSERRDLRVVAGSLFVISLISMAGPWGAAGLTSRLLAREFTATLVGANALREGQLTSGPEEHTGRLLRSDRTRLTSIATYLCDKGRLGLLAPLVGNEAVRKDILEDVAPPQRRGQLTRFLAHAGLPPASDMFDPLRTASRRYVSFNIGGGSAAAQAIPDKAWLAGPISLSRHGAPHITRIMSGDQPSIGVSLADAKLVVTHSDGRTVFFPADDIVDLADAANGTAIGAEARPALRLSRTDGAFAVDLIVTSANGTIDAEAPPVRELNGVTVWIAWTQ